MIPSSAPFVRVAASPRFDQCGFAVVDLETTGFNAARDAIVEVTVVHVDPGGATRVAFDSVIDPGRPVAGTHVHGLTDRDVVTAPSFREAAGDLARALAGRVLVGHNLSFDLTFLARGLASVGIDEELPYICTMYLRPLLGVGPRVTLDEACREAGLHRRPGHAARNDALDTADLFRWQLAGLARARIATFAGLARRGDYAFVRSLHHDPLAPEVAAALPGCDPQPRVGESVAASPRHRAYFEALAAALMDLEITAAEAVHLTALRRRLRLTHDEVRAMHAQAFAGAILVLSGDQRIDDQESGYLRQLGGCLSELEWAPRDP